ncbi:MAG TPA: TSUP family transporter [Solirubrobacteraceae bacterium]|nr:TSUP family transporter [Solirubrobacteraceae bacterium]
MPETEIVLLLCVAALLAGWVDAVVGGGGLIQIPALLVLLPGATPAQVLATNKLSSVFGTATAAWTYARRVRPDLRTALPMAAAATAGAAAGAACASLLPESAFRPLVLVLLVLVGTYTLRRPALGEVQELRFDGRQHLAAALGAAVSIGFYDGIFGPGTGSFLVFALVALMGYSFVQASAKARIVNLATNLGALAVFIPQGAPMYGVGLAMAACNVLGGRLGAVTAISRGSRFVRVVFLVVVGVLLVRLAVDVARGG